MAKSAKRAGKTQIKNLRDWLAAAEASPEFIREVMGKWGCLFA